MFRNVSNLTAHTAIVSHKISIYVFHVYVKIFTPKKQLTYIVFKHSIRSDPMQPSISVLPGDERMEYVCAELGKKGAQRCSSWEEIADSGLILCGIPFTKDQQFMNTSLKPTLHIDSFLGLLTSSHIVVGGALPETVTRWCTDHNIKYYDVLTAPGLAEKNAKLTAEGLLVHLFTQTSFSAGDFRTLIIGYGRCGREIASILHNFTEEIYIYDTDPAALKAARSHHFKVIPDKSAFQEHPGLKEINTLINTVPGQPLEDKLWHCFPEHCIVFQVASGPLALPLPLSEHLVNCPGIPGKYAPKTAGRLIANEICHHFHL